jgi:hypothetical protein
MPGGDVLVLLGPGADALEAFRRLRRAERSGKPHDEPPWGADDTRRDPPSVAYELGRHEDDWRRVRGEPGADGPHTVAGAARYLHATLTWAAARHRGFGEFVTDLTALRHRVDTAAGLVDRPERAGVPCFGCGGDLIRPYGHQGREDDWSCRRCHRVYDQASYLLAVRASLEEETG